MQKIKIYPQGLHNCADGAPGFNAGGYGGTDIIVVEW